jgi:NAD(P)-dependent dehydrogenase (short-subunit alcohol dehydrogenase family)
MDLGLKDKVALVTGVGSQVGFGRGIAVYLAKEGCDIIGVDIDLEGAKKTCEQVRALGRQALAIKTNVADRAEVKDMVKKVVAEFHRIDILVNNAGTSTVLMPFIEMSEEDCDILINVNLHGQMNVAREVIPHMLSRRYGRIVNITGGQGGANISVYGASKAGVTAWTKSIASELVEKGIIVNGIHPGLGNTGLNYLGRGGRFLTEEEEREIAEKMFGLKRFCKGEDMGSLVAYLASDACSYMVGEVINMSAGAIGGRFP